MVFFICSNVPLKVNKINILSTVDDMIKSLLEHQKTDLFCGKNCKLVYSCFKKLLLNIIVVTFDLTIFHNGFTKSINVMIHETDAKIR